MIEILAVFAITFWAYFKTLKFGLIVDDISLFKSISEGLFHKTKFAKVKLWYLFQKCVVQRLYGVGTFAYSTKETGEGCTAQGEKWHCNLRFERIFGVFLTGLTASLIYIAFGKNVVSLTAGILWAINPINNQLTIWLNGRRYIINIILVLTMLIFKPLGFILFPLTPLFQISAIFAPVLCGWWGLGLSIIVIYLFRQKIFSTIIGRMESIADKTRLNFTWKKLVVVSKFYGNYFFRMIHPKNTLMIYPGFHYYYGVTLKGEQEATEIWSWDLLKGITALSLTLIGLLTFKGDLFFYWLFMFLSILQWCAIIPITQELADRYASLPNVFAMFFTVHLLNTYLGVYSWAVIGLLAGYYLTQLQNTMMMYKNIDAYWKYHDFFAPQCPRPRTFKIGWLLNRQEVSDAWCEVKKGLEHNPTDYALNKQACLCSNSVGLTDQARHFLNVCKENIYIGMTEKSLQELQKLSEIIDQTESMMQSTVNTQPSQNGFRQPKKKRKSRL